jgi:hypothetical protein
MVKDSISLSGCKGWDLPTTSVSVANVERFLSLLFGVLKKVKIVGY